MSHSNSFFRCGSKIFSLIFILGFMMPVPGQTGRTASPRPRPFAGKKSNPGSPLVKRRNPLAETGRSAAQQVVSSGIPAFEGFEDVSTLVPAGWFFQNNSSPLGIEPDYFQGELDTSAGLFAAQSGSPTSYIAVTYLSVDGRNTVSNWMLTPNGPLHNGDVVRFWTRRVEQEFFPDRLQVRLSTNGTSTNVGTTATDLGDFTTLLLDINPTYNNTDFPQDWRPFSITLSGLPSEGTNGRIAFRYFVEDSGPEGPNGSYIGIDNFAFLPNQVNNQASLVVTSQGLTGITGGCATAGYTNRYSINVDLRNLGPNTLSNPYFTVLELQQAYGSPTPANPFRLHTADDFNDATCTGGLIGSFQSIPGPIAPNQLVPVTFLIDMPRMGRFRYVGTLSATTQSGTAANRPVTRLGRLAIEGKGFDATGKPILTATFIPEPGPDRGLSVNSIQATPAK